MLNVADADTIWRIYLLAPVIFCALIAGALHSWYVHKGIIKDLRESIVELREALKVLDVRD